MKKVKFMTMSLMMCLSFKSFCQSDTLVTDNAEKWFKSSYVNVNFKDPQSYVLSEIQSTPVYDSSNINVIYYKIYLECYGNNSLGKLVLGSFSFHFKPNELKGFNMLSLDNGIAWSWAQNVTKIKTPGGLIISSQNDWLIGTTLTATGGLIILSPSLINDANTKPTTVIGLVFFGVGACFYISSHVKMKKAGILLNENGIGLKINL